MHRYTPTHSRTLSPSVILCVMGFLGGCGPSEVNRPPPQPNALGIVLANVREAALSEDCAAGGVDIETGVDKNADGELSFDEVARIVTLCHGTAGRNALVETEAVEAGDACDAGGIRILSGLDTNLDGSLSSNEVIRNDVICHGAAGADGVISLVVISNLESGDACIAGGVTLKSGLDVNGDRELSDEEVSQEATVCNGVPGERGEKGASCTVTRDESAGRTTVRCEDGSVANLYDGEDGARGPSGTAGPPGANGENGANCTVTDNQNGTKTVSCEDGTRVILTDGENGEAGQDGANGSLIRLEPELGGPFCPYSGTKILSGVDDNRDGILQDEEVDDEAIVCSSMPGSCAESYHAAPDGRCTSNIRDCVLPNGTGTETWNNGIWGSCSLANCDPGYRVDSSAHACRECQKFGG